MGTIAELDEFFGGSVVEFFAARAMGQRWKARTNRASDPIPAPRAVPGWCRRRPSARQKVAPSQKIAWLQDLSAFGAIRALNKAGVRVPEQCSVIGFDDIATSALYTPSLTTVRQPMEAMGASAVGIVLDGINAVLEKREIAATHRKVVPELVARESTRSLA